MPARLRSPTRRETLAAAVYRHGAVIVWLPTFFGCWVYCIQRYGVSLGIGLGWLPSILVATVAGTLWPLLVVSGAVVAWVFWTAG